MNLKDYIENVRSALKLPPVYAHTILKAQESFDYLAALLEPREDTHELAYEMKGRLTDASNDEAVSEVIGMLNVHTGGVRADERKRIRDVVDRMIEEATE